MTIESTLGHVIENNNINHIRKIISCFFFTMKLVIDGITECLKESQRKSLYFLKHIVLTSICFIHLLTINV